MGFYEKLIRTEEPNIRVHWFKALAGEVRRGKVTGTAARQFLGLTVQEGQDANALITHFSTEIAAGRMTVDEVDDVLLLCNASFYTTVADFKTRIGMA